MNDTFANPHWTCKGTLKIAFTMAKNLLKTTYCVVAWPYEMHRQMFLAEATYLTSYGQERVSAKKRLDRVSVVANRSRMIEVCSESSFQPLLQFYLFLPVLLVFLATTSGVLDFNKSANELFGDVAGLQFWSILTSCVSLAWSLTNYQCAKKKGALNFTENPLGRLFLLVSNILQITTRLLALVLFAYSCGDGNFWPMFLLVLVHILLLAWIHDDSREENKFTRVYQATLNGISNIYMYSKILPLPHKDKKMAMIVTGGEEGQVEEIYYKKDQSFRTQVSVDSIFLLENIIFIILAALSTDVPWPVLLFVIIGQIVGLLFKGTYYNFFHIWSPIFNIRNPFSGKERIV